MLRTAVFREKNPMIYQVIQAGWVYEIEAPLGCCVEGPRGGEPYLRIGGDGVSGTTSLLTPRAIVRAAKDHLLGLNCTRSWRIDLEHQNEAPACAIIPVS